MTTVDALFFNGPAQADRAFLIQIEQIQGPCPDSACQIDDEDAKFPTTTIWSFGHWCPLRMWRRSSEVQQSFPVPPEKPAAFR